MDLSPCIRENYMDKSQGYSSVGYKLPMILHNTTMVAKMMNDDNDYI